MEVDGLLQTGFRSVCYKRIDGKELFLLIAAPGGMGPPRPAVVWVHGGGWNSDGPERCLPHIAYFSRLGAAAVSVEYRLSGKDGATVYDCVADCIDAVRYLHAHAEEFRIDPRRIALCGDSAGGHLALCAASPAISGTARSLAAAVVDCNGIIDLTMKWRLALPQEEQCPCNDPRLWLANYRKICSVSPVYRVSPQNPPTLILHGLADTVVEPEEAVRYYDALRLQGVDAELELLPGAPHAFILFRYELDDEAVLRYMERIRRFLTKRNVLSG